MTTTTGHTDQTVRERDSLGERLFAGLLGGMELLSVGLGVRTGLYAALRDTGPATPGQLAARSGVTERYAREWLEQQAAAGFVHVASPAEEAAARTYRLPAGHAEALLEPESPGYAAPAASGLVGLAQLLDTVAAAYHSRQGVAYADYGAEIRNFIGGFNRPMFVNELASEWLPTLGPVHELLSSGARVRVLDVACGTGWSSIALARAYPNVYVDGIDLDPASIAEADRHLTHEDVGGRVRFMVGDGAVPHITGGYQLACIFEALHDMGDPVGVLRSVRAALADGAPLLIADERVADSFTAPAEEIERFNYGWSVLHCLPATLAESPKIAHGTVLRADTVRAWAEEAGYRKCQVLPIEHDFWRFYRLDS